MTDRHAISVLVRNDPGVLQRVSGLFSRRGYNIDSISVGDSGQERCRARRLEPPGRSICPA
ncbi:acetolactate synthase small subunit [Cohnella phaseoli]|uniref:acetolactate synthase n=1 Tax=Cohnella phaseoli TaxID=456490 RepID=A0A3D9KDG0_9BACL|nr:acetolactate synthase small subunit [Cohnella phaseoli]